MKSHVMKTLLCASLLVGATLTADAQQRPSRRTVSPVARPPVDTRVSSTVVTPETVQESPTATPSASRPRRNAEPSLYETSGSDSPARPKNQTSNQTTTDDTAEIPVDAGADDADVSTTDEDARIAAEEQAARSAARKRADLLEQNRRGTPVEEEEAQAVLPYYNNFLSTYRLGPEDVITVEVFNQPRYSRANITVPPNGKLSYYFVKGGINVAGMTTTDLENELARRLDEYIIDPDVTVTLEKAVSARYSIIGDVPQPGVRILTRRLTVREAIAETGGILETGNRSKIQLLRPDANGKLSRTEINLAQIEKGKIPDEVYLAPGDQIIVPGNTFKKIEKVTRLLSLATFAQLFRF